MRYKLKIKQCRYTRRKREILKELERNSSRSCVSLTGAQERNA